MVKAVIFDIDGTLIDSVDFHAAAWVEAFAHFGHKVPFRDVRKQIGMGGDKLMPTFLGADIAETIGEALEEFRGKLFKKVYLDRLRPFSAVRALFQRLQDDGIAVALASSAKADELARYKRIAEIEDLLDGETSSDDAAESKPEPDIFMAAFAQLENIRKQDVVVIGDSPFDALAAGKAKMACVGVLCGGFSSRSLKAAGCKAIYQSPSDLYVHYDAVFDVTR